MGHHRHFYRERGVISVEGMRETASAGLSRQESAVTVLAAGRLGSPAVGLAPWTSHLVPRADGGGNLTVLAVPAVHGPEDGERDADGNVNCEVTGFVLSGQGLPTLYVSGDNASIRTVAE